VGLNGGPHFKFNEAISFVVNCKTQAEVDRFWKRLSAGGKKVQCGWLKDRFGVSWQVVPTILGELLSGKDAVKSQRVMRAMLRMVKLDIKKLKQAGRGK
jgi:predicted 3-demethylubiquinone-9 3-methyltransferase (glyoxalase superfamily)